MPRVSLDGVGIEYREAAGIAGRIIEMFGAGEFDVCTVIYNPFRSAMTQIVTRQQLVPFAVAGQDDGPEQDEEDAAAGQAGGGVAARRG